MSAQSLEERITVIEAEIEALKQKTQDKKTEEPRGWKRIVGVFANDPEFEEAMRLGREYRESLRPKDDEEA